jgi:uncharacterized protein YifE (UPF0438 family)
MVDLIYRERLLPLAELCQRFPGMFDRTEIELLESSSPRVLPTLTGQIPTQSQRQADFIDVLMGKAEPTTRAEAVWRKFVVLQQSADESLRRRSDNETKATFLTTLKSRVSELEHSLERANATIQELEASLSAVVTQVDENLVPKHLMDSGVFQHLKADIVLRKAAEDYTMADIDLILHTNGLERLDQTSMSKLYNRMLMLDYDPIKLQLVKDRLSTFITPGWNPANAFGVYANTDGQ